MLKEINKLIVNIGEENTTFCSKLKSIAAKIERKNFVGKKFILIDIEDMESWIDPDKVSEEEVSLGNVELDL